MIQMVVTVIMIMLIASFAVLRSRDTLTETRVAEVYEEITTIKRAVIEAQLIDSDILNSIPNGKLDNLEDYSDLQDYYNPELDYYLLDFNTNKAILNDILEVGNIKSNYIVATDGIQEMQIFLINGLKFNDDICYTDAEILEKYNDVFIGR